MVVLSYEESYRFQMQLYLSRTTVMQLYNGLTEAS